MENYKRNLIILFLFFSTLIIAEKPQKLVFVGSKSYESPNIRWLAAVQSEALKRMGIEFEFKKVPTKRASYYLNKGLVDGDLARVYRYGDTNKNIVRVDEPVTLVSFSAFSTDPTIKVNGWESLKDSDYVFDYKYGVMIIEKTLPKYVDPKNIQTSPSFESGIKKLMKKRTDIYIGNSFEVFRIIQEFESKNMKINNIYLAGEVEQITNHVFLHKKHIELVEELSETLKVMKKEGMFEKIRVKIGIPKHLIAWE